MEDQKSWECTLTAWTVGDKSPEMQVQYSFPHRILASVFLEQVQEVERDSPIIVWWLTACVSPEKTVFWDQVPLETIEEEHVSIHRTFCVGVLFVDERNCNDFVMMIHVLLESTSFWKEKVRDHISFLSCSAVIIAFVVIMTTGFYRSVNSSSMWVSFKTRKPVWYSITKRNRNKKNIVISTLAAESQKFHPGITQPHMLMNRSDTSGLFS